MDSIQSVGDVFVPKQARPQQWVVRRDVLAYGAVVLVALVLRIAQLDVVPMSQHEARQALAAWRVVYPEVAGTSIVPESPLLFAVHGLMFSVLGASEFSARIMTVIASILLLLSPLLFAQLLGRLRAFIAVLLLAFSSTFLATSRMDSPVVWTMLVAMLGLWGMWRYREVPQPRFAILATVCAASIIFLTDPTGMFVVLMLILAGLFVVWLRRATISDSDIEVDPHQNSNIEHNVVWPWAASVPVAILVLFLVSTAFMLNPGGVTAVGELINSGLRGLTVPRPYTPPFFSLLAMLFYEPVLVVLGLVGAYQILTSERVTIEDQFLLGWLIFGAAFSLMYAGTGSEHTLWLVVPLVGVASRSVRRLVKGGSRSFAPSYSRWLIALVTAALMAMVSIHAQAIARSLLTAVGPTFLQSSVNPQNLIGIVIAVLLTLIGYFLAASEWGEEIAIRGGSLGVVAFFSITGLGGGWHMAVENADNAVEFWNRNPTSYQTAQLRDTLVELAHRETAGFPQLAVTVLAADDGVVAWLLRDFPNTTFITDPSAAKAQNVVILPVSIAKPDLGGAYVGHSTAISYSWDYGSVTLMNFPAWWFQRRTLTTGLPSDSVTLWLRQDIYSGVKPLVPQ